MRKKRKTVWAFLDGKKLVDVVQAALDNNMMVDDLKAKLIAENPGHEVTFIRQGGWCIRKPPISTLFPKSRCIKIWVWIRLKLWKRWIPAPVRYVSPLMER